MSNPSDEMCRFVTWVADLVKEEWRTSMLHNDKLLARSMVYIQYIEKYILGRIAISMKRRVQGDQSQLISKKKFSSQDEHMSSRVKLLQIVVLKRASLHVLLCNKALSGMTIAYQELFWLCIDGHKLIDRPSIVSK